MQYSNPKPSQSNVLGSFALHTATLAFGLTLVALASPAATANDVLNGDFDTDVSMWRDITDASSWDMLDVDGSVSSGSVRMTEDNHGFTGRFEQDINVIAEESYEFAGCARIPPGQTSIGYVAIGVNWYSGACPNPVGNLGFDELPQVSNVGSWECGETVVVAPPGAQCGVATLWFRNNGGTGPFTVHFDAIFLPEPDGALALAIGCAALVLLARLSRARARDERAAYGRSDSRLLSRLNRASHGESPPAASHEASSPPVR